MIGFVKDIEQLAVENTDFRRVLYTAKHCQLVLMALEPKEEIGAAVHQLDQFFRVEAGSGDAVLDGVITKFEPALRSSCWPARTTTSSTPVQFCSNSTRAVTNTS